MLTIGKVASMLCISTDTLRHYEREGLIQPVSASEAGYRLYDDDSVRRVRFVRQAQQCGFTLTEIRELLALREQRSACCNDVRRLAIERKLQLEAKIKALKDMSAALDGLIVECTDGHVAMAACPILAGLEKVGGS